MKQSRLVAIALLVLMLIAPTPTRAATTIELRNLREYAAFADWSYRDQANHDVFVSVVVSEFVERPGGASGPLLTATVFAVDEAGFVVFSGTSGVEAFTFTISHSLRTAHAIATLPVFDDVSGELLPLAVDVTWTGIGAVQSFFAHEHTHENGVVTTTHFQGRQRWAQAEGTVAISDCDQCHTPEPSWNFTQVPSVAALIHENSSGSVSITLPTP